MATLVKRVDSEGNVSWQVRIRRRGAPAVSRTFARKADAQAWADMSETALRAGELVGSDADHMTLGEALDRYAREVTPLKKSSEQEFKRIVAWQRHPLAAYALSRLRGSDFATYRDERRADGKAENTIRLDLALISHLFRVAQTDWGFEGLRNPIRSLRMPGNSTPRDRRLWPDEEAALLPELAKLNPYLRPLVELALETAMRRGELLGLTWQDVDLQRRVAHLADTKNGTPRDVPLSTRAVEIIKALPAPIDRAVEIIQPLPAPIDRPRPMFPLKPDQVTRLFATACGRAGIEGVVFHTLRHEAVTRLCARLPMHEAMRVSGHKTPSMLSRYYHPRAEDLAAKLG